MRRKLQHYLKLLLAALLLGGAEGCKTYSKYSPTYNLWNQDQSPSFCRPQADLQLALFDLTSSGGDLLVIYNCGSERHPGLHRRAYFLAASRTNITAGQPPCFVDPKLGRSHPPLLVVSQYSTGPTPSPTNIWAKTHNEAFTLYRPGQPPENCPLPVYQDYFPNPDLKSGYWWRVALTPVTATLDVAVGVVVTVAVVGTYTAGIWVPFVH